MNTQVQAAETAHELMREYQDKLTRSLYEAIYRLDDTALDALMEAQSRSCLGVFFGLTAPPSPMDLDSFLDAMSTAGTSQVDIQRDGNLIYWTERHQGRCICPLVRLEVVSLDAKLCTCAVHFVERLFRTLAKTPVSVEMIETVATGAENCCFRVTIEDVPEPAGHGA